MNSIIKDINNKQCNEYDVERKASLSIKKRKFENYKLYVNNFKLNNPTIYEIHKTNQLFNLKLNDMKVHSIEVNIYLLKNRIMVESYKNWEFNILNVLKVSERTIQGNNINNHTDAKDVKKLTYVKKENDNIEIDDIEFKLPTIKNNLIDEFYQNFMKNRKSDKILILENKDFTDSNEIFLNILNGNKSRKKRGRNTMSIPLIELKKSDILEWSCPIFKK